VKKTDILIIGAGLTGLSCAFKLEKKRADYLLAEKENWAGGLARSFRKDGFTFDYSGHLLHLRWPETSKFILDSLGKNAKPLKRKARIYSSGKFTAYPFQMNLKGLPAKVRSECVEGFLKARRAFPEVKAENFRDWCLQTFGKGISKHFFFPYNAKLWNYPLEKLSTDWMGQFVPVPKTEEVLYGAYKDDVKGAGYNHDFYYPETGGINALPAAIASGVERLSLDSELISLNAANKTARLRNLGNVRYKKLLSTIPLKYLAEKVEKAPETVRKNAELLEHNQVYILNLGVRKCPLPQHWIYFPEKEFVFYRAGVYTNFSPSSAPRGFSSLYVETASKSGEFIDLKKAEGRIVKNLVSIGAVKDEDDILTSMWLKVPCAYVIYNEARKKALPELLSWFEKRGISSAGRYGAWKYSFMEESVKEGFETAEKLLKR